jgi:ATP-dependent protease HslVU (ClpYQ) peptidase subunit
MTCIVGYVEKGISYIAADGQISAGHYIVNNNSDKIYINNDIIAAFSGSVYLCDIIEKIFMNINTQDISDFKFDIYNHLILPVKKEIKYREMEEKDINFSGLLARRDELIEVSHHPSVAPYKEKYATGSGGYYALASLETISKIKKMPVLEKIKISLEVASSLDTGTNNNWTYADTKNLKIKKLI